MIDKNLEQQDVDRVFIAAKLIDLEFGGKPSAENESRFCRYMFLEFIVRIADQKYRRTKIVDKYSQAVEKLMEHFKSNFNVSKIFPW